MNESELDKFAEERSQEEFPDALTEVVEEQIKDELPEIQNEVSDSLVVNENEDWDIAFKEAMKIALDKRREELRRKLGPKVAHTLQAQKRREILDQLREVKAVRASGNY